MSELTDGGTQGSVIHQRRKELRRLCANTSRARWTSLISSLGPDAPHPASPGWRSTLSRYAREFLVYESFCVQKSAHCFLFVRKKETQQVQRHILLHDQEWRRHWWKRVNKALITVIKHGYPCVAWTRRFKCETFEVSQVANMYRSTGLLCRTEELDVIIWVILLFQQTYWLSQYRGLWDTPQILQIKFIFNVDTLQSPKCF